MSGVDKSFQHQANTNGDHLGSRTNLWSILAILPFWGVVVGAHLRYCTVPPKNFEFHSVFYKVILIKRFPNYNVVSFPKFPTRRKT